MEYTAFIATWCRWVSFDRDSERLALKEKSNFDCIFWKDTGSEGTVGCVAYRARPLQCRAFPFWDSVVCSPEAWETTGRACPGINSGKLHSREEIEDFLRLMGEELVIERIVPRIGGGV